MPVTKKTLSSYYRSFVAALKQKSSKHFHGSRMHKLLKTLLILVGVFIAIAAIVIIFISPITKYLVEKYDLKYTIYWVWKY